MWRLFCHFVHHLSFIKYCVVLFGISWVSSLVFVFVFLFIFYFCWNANSMDPDQQCLLSGISLIWRHVWPNISCSYCNIKPNNCRLYILRQIHTLENFNLYHSLGKFNIRQMGDIFLFFPENRLANSCKLSPHRQFAENAKACSVF